MSATTRVAERTSVEYILNTLEQLDLATLSVEARQQLAWHLNYTLDELDKFPHCSVIFCKKLAKPNVISIYDKSKLSLDERTRLEKKLCKEHFDTMLVRFTECSNLNGSIHKDNTKRVNGSKLCMNCICPPCRGDFLHTNKINPSCDSCKL